MFIGNYTETAVKIIISMITDGMRQANNTVVSKAFILISQIIY
jgi:hypothetical protein